MKVTKLRLENFRNHEDSTFNFGSAAFVVIRGRNWAGKSSVGQGLSMCLTSTASGLDPKGTGFASKIRRGQAKAVITTEMQTKHYLIKRTVTLNTNSQGRTQSNECLSDPKWNPQPFDKKLEEIRAALGVVLNSDAFLRMNEGEQKNLLAGLALPRTYAFDGEIVAGVEKVLGANRIKFEDEPFAVIQQAYKLLFAERQIVNRQVREFVIPAPLEMPANGGMDSHAIEEQMTLLRVERREKQGQRDKAVNDANQVEVKRVKASAKAQGIREKIDKDTSSGVSIRAFVLPEDRIGYLRKVAGGRGELDRLAEEKKQAEAVVDDCLRQLGRIEDLPEDGRNCPTCSQPIDKAKLAALTERLTADLKEAKNANNRLHEKLKALGEVKEAVEELAKNDERLAELAAIAKRLEDNQKLLAAALNDVGEPVLFDFAPYDRSLAELDAEIERLGVQLRPVIAAEERNKEIAIRHKQLASLKESAGLLDVLVKYFDKDGIKAKLLAQYIGGFEQKVNEVMAAWNYSVALSIDPYTFDVTNARGDVIPVRELSGAERVMFSIAFQCAVSRTANIGLVVIDEVAMFLPELRPLMNKCLYGMVKDGHLEQVILLVADASEVASPLAGTAFFMVAEGAVTKLAAKQAAA